MPVSAETAIGKLTPRVLRDPELVPKLDQHHLTEDDIREALGGHASELTTATVRAQQDWDAATAARQAAQSQLYDQLTRPIWRRAALSLSRRLGPIFPFVADRSLPPSKAELEEEKDKAGKREAEAEQSWWDAAYTNWGRPLVTALINEYEDHSYRSRLPAVPGSGLAETYHPEYEVPTAVGTKLASLFTHMPGGSIGLSGFRGSGKTTLIRSVCQTRAGSPESGPASIGFVVSAPVRYEPRDFVLYLFARLCMEILGIPPGSEPSQRVLEAPDRSGAIPRRYRPWLLLAAGLAALAAGGLVLAAAVSGVSAAHLLGTFGARITAGVVLSVAGVVLLLPGTWALMTARSRHYRTPPSRYGPYQASSQHPEVEYEQRDSARRWLADIRYQLTYTSGWSGSLTISAAQASVSGGTQVEERQRTLPNIIDGYKNLVSALSKQEIRTFIGVDELDKLGSEQDAELFLNEVKAIFGIDGCFYLVSVSENAMSSFERRGLPFRDVFDSTFDEIVRIERFRYAQSRRLIKRRTVMSDPFTALCHCISGGLPRDLIRAARSLYRLNAELELDGSLRDVTRAVITEDLHAKTAASWVELSKITIEPEATLFKSWFRRATAPPIIASAQDQERPDFWLVDGDALYQTCQDFWPEARTWPKLSPGAPEGGQEGTEPTQWDRLSALGLEINAYRYLAATIVQFFDSQPTDSDLRTAADPSAQQASFEMLAEARLLFVNGPLLAWSMISDFRTAHNMGALSQPDPCWLGTTGNGTGPADAPERGRVHEASADRDGGPGSTREGVAAHSGA